MTTSYRPLANEVGCLSAEIYKEIRRCLRLRGGVVIDGVKWIWKTSEELAQRLGVNEKTIRRHLKALVQMGWLKREQHQKKWGMRAFHYSLGDNAPLKSGYIAQSVGHLHGMRVLSGKSAIDTPPSKQSVSSRPLLPQSSALSSRIHSQAVSAEMPLQSGRFGPSEPDILSASINRNTTTKNSPPSQNSLNSQGASRQTEKVPTGGDRRAHNPKVESSKPLAFKTRAINNTTTTQKTSDDSGEGRIRTDGLSNQEGGIRTLEASATTKRPSRRSLYAARALEPETSATNASPIPSHWPDTSGFSEGLLRVCIENARNLAFPGHRNRAQSYGIV
jgi:hypothetical protein